MTRSLMGVLAVAGIGLTALCDKPRPEPIPSPTATVEPTAPPTAVPTPTPYECPAFDPAKLRLPCGPHAERGDGQTVWDCTLKYNGQPYMPEGDPHALECQLQAMQGRPEFMLVGASGDLQLVRRENSFQFNLKGSGTGYLSCRVGEFDPCQSQAVSR